MRNFSKKLAFVLAAAMVFTAFAPAAKADAAEKEMAMNRATQTLYVNEGVNDAGKVEGLTGNKQAYDFYVANKPDNWKTEYTFDWSSSDENVITVGKAGLTTAVAVGKAQVICVVTDKATKVETKLTADVTVKANAAEVYLKEASLENDDAVVEVGATIDLDRVMVDEKGNETSKRGKFVTDYTRWIAEDADGEDADGVVIDPATGKFTFNEAGVYTLYCQTYQSEKYSQATATSEKITVTVEEAVKEIEIDQKTPTQFVIDLGAKVDKVGKIELIKLISSSKGEVYPVPVTLKKTELKDGKVTVDLYSAVADKSNYLVKVEGYEDYTWTAYNGKPYEIILSGKADSVVPVVYAGSEQQIYVTILDVNGVNVTNDTYKSKIVYNVKDYSADGSYYVTEAGKIYFLKEGLYTTVTAEYLSGEFDDNGNAVGNVPAEMEFHAIAVEPVKIETITGTLYNIDKDKDTKSMSVPYGDNVKLEVKIKTSDQQQAVAVVSGQEVNGGYITFETASPDFAAIDDAMKLYLFKEGTATILVRWTDKNDATKSEPIAALPITITEARKLTNLSLSSQSVTVGTADGFAIENLTINAKDKYGDEVAVTKVEVTGANALAKEVVTGVEENDTKNITLNGATLKAALKNGATAVQLNFTVKVNDALTTNLTVLVKAKGADGATQPGFAITDGKFENVDRNVDSKNVKSVTITAFKFNNGIKVGYTELEKAPADVSNAVVGNYYVKVKKNNTDVTNNASIEVSGSDVKITFTTKKALNGYQVVDYGLGAGNYVVELYKCTEQGGKKVLAKQNPTLVGTATQSGNSYSLASRDAEAATLTGDTTLDAALRAIFTFKNTKSENATADYTVDKLGSADAGYVYVKSFTFYDDLGDGTYAAYTVPVNTSVKVN